MIRDVVLWLPEVPSHTCTCMNPYKNLHTCRHTYTHIHGVGGRMIAAYRGLSLCCLSLLRMCPSQGLGHSTLYLDRKVMLRRFKL